MARALIRAAPDHVRGWAGPSASLAIEAYPRGESPGVAPRLHDEEAWVGTQGLFESCGFVRVVGEPAYPVMRKAL